MKRIARAWKGVIVVAPFVPTRRLGGFTHQRHGSACADGCGARVAPGAEERVEAVQSLIDSSTCVAFEEQDCTFMPLTCLL